MNLTDNPDYLGKTEKGDGSYIDTHHARYICPAVGIEMNGVYKFVYLWGCGCVLSERAIKHIRTTNCHKVGTNRER